MRPGISATYQNLPESDCGSFRYTSHVTTMFTYQAKQLRSQQTKTHLMAIIRDNFSNSAL